MAQVRAPAYQSTKATLIVAVVLNVQWTQIVPEIAPVVTKNVKTLAPEPAVWMPIAVLSTTLLRVRVGLDIKEIQWFLVICLFNHVRSWSLSYFSRVGNLDLIFTRNMFLVEEEKVTDPCQPSPCGPFSQCRVVNGHAVCSCQPEYIGAPPTCHPECMVSSDCTQDKACINQKCRDPCPGTCGLSAKCQVLNHNPICSCPPGFTGDPFLRCQPQESKHCSDLSNFCRPQRNNS